MSDNARNTIGSIVSGGGLLGAITLRDANEWAALACSVFGTIAATLTIIAVIWTWIKKRHGHGSHHSNSRKS